MQACFTVSILLVALAFAASVELDSDDSPHVIEKRDTIFVRPPFPQCVFWQCTSGCRSRGFWKGGYCTITGCQCIS
nr:unnamed protein product [Amyelois transitella]